MPDTYYRELFYPFSPIFQMFYYLETGELLKLVIEAYLFHGARMQATGNISGTSNLRQATGEKSCHLIKWQEIPTKDRITHYSNTQLHLQKLPLRQALSCHFTCKCYAGNWCNFHNRSSWPWH